MNQSCQKLLLVLKQLGFQTFTSSIPPISIFLHQSVNLDSFAPEEDCSFPGFQKKSHRYWNPDRPEVAKVILVQTYLKIPTRPSLKLQLSIFVSGSELTLSYYYTILTLKILWFYSLN